MIRSYYQLTKPGIIFGNTLTALGGLALASRGHIDPVLWLVTLLGLAFIIASSCVFNNYLDRSADEKMTRTHQRALVQGTISPKSALLFATVLALAGAFLLAFFTPPLTLFLAFFGMAVYLLLYTPLKYRTPWATLVGSIAGAMPPLVGYTAVTSHLDFAALLLFLILVFWQMPHFFAIAMLHLDQFAAASIPVLPLRRGIRVAKLHMFGYILAFLVVVLLLPLSHFVGWFYGIASVSWSLYWLNLSYQGFKTKDNAKWARKMFLGSLQVITVLAAMLVVDACLKQY